MAASQQGKAVVFLCHAGESKPFVRQLVDRLETDGLKKDQIFFDERSLEPGDDLDSIIKAIESPSLKLFVFVVSKYCFDSDRTWIRAEWEAALTNNKKIFPIWLDDNNDDFKAFGNLVRKFSYKLRKLIAQRVNPQEISTSLPGLSEKICSHVCGYKSSQQRPPTSTDNAEELMTRLRGAEGGAPEDLDSDATEDSDEDLQSATSRTYCDLCGMRANVDDLFCIDCGTDLRRGY
ncbi:Hypp4869 [Branchiostoma lanceolatum]|uniref:Hypp4869 protein n=1 Tax=Branchiostoma lanceolatum TaxID=7740 RepID=A0A8K0ABX6_BRALA|nr:Hypp4869 [Branchiostoma lanceolatum]